MSRYTPLFLYPLPRLGCYCVRASPLSGWSRQLHIIKIFISVNFIRALLCDVIVLLQRHTESFYIFLFGNGTSQPASELAVIGRSRGQSEENTRCVVRFPYFVFLLMLTLRCRSVQKYPPTGTASLRHKRASTSPKFTLSDFSAGV